MEEIESLPEAEEEDSVNNLCSTAHFALALKILVGQFNKRYDKKFQMRIGKWAYDRLYHIFFTYAEFY